MVLGFSSRGTAGVERGSHVILFMMPTHKNWDLNNREYRPDSYSVLLCMLAEHKSTSLSG